MANKLPKNISNREPNEAEILLGSLIRAAREAKQLKPMQLARAINVKEQQIRSYEKGGFVPLAIIEKLGDALDMPVAKRSIRRISFLRKLEKETHVEQTELSDLYRFVFTADDDVDDDM